MFKIGIADHVRKEEAFKELNSKLKKYEKDEEEVVESLFGVAKPSVEQKKFL